MMSSAVLIRRAPRAPANSVTYSADRSPIGAASTVASATITIVPTSSGPMPPPGAAISGGGLMMNDRLSEPAAFLMTVKSTRPSTATATAAASLARGRGNTC